MSGVSKNRAFEKSGVKLQCLTEANPRETTFGTKNREFRKIEYSKNRDSTVDLLHEATTYAKPDCACCCVQCLTKEFSLFGRW